ncbi:hypothetical protein [Streptomyces sp. NPDC058086]|uniref:hypothetical protein n=1 Tax=Streptomyces sp. NPDC058086 TaxID=3346334 RepID=UPI0036E9BB3C
METSEIMRRVIGILTKGAEWEKLLTEDPDRTDIQIDGTVDAFVREMIPTKFEVPGNATPQAVADAMAREMIPAVGRMIACFSMAYLELAHEYDATQPDKTSAVILRDLALRAETLNGE